MDPIDGHNTDQPQQLVKDVDELTGCADDQNFSNAEVNLIQVSIQQTIVPGIYRHFKGGLYYVFGEGIIESTREPVVIYRPLQKKTEQQTVRTKSDWFAPLDKFDQWFTLVTKL